ncbi:MAG: TerB N-terminal domain-containing protein [Brevinematia bacterium]
MYFLTMLFVLLLMSVIFNTIIALIFPRIFFWNKEPKRLKNLKQGGIAILILFFLSVFFAGLSGNEEANLSDVNAAILSLTFLCTTIGFLIYASFKLLRKQTDKKIAAKEFVAREIVPQETVPKEKEIAKPNLSSYNKSEHNSSLYGKNELAIKGPTLHPDLEELIWIGDGPYKNYSPEPINTYTINMDSFEIMIHFLNNEEPSLIYTTQKISKPMNISKVERPPYFPRYRELTPEQKWIYLKFLTNPYDKNIDIGYVFILYYGLERHLLKGNYEKAFRTILKLRDVHQNPSFQRYSANALILSAMLQGRGDLVAEFIESLDKEYEFKFSDNLFLICYYSFDKPIKAQDIVRMAKSFGFTNMNYIKKYPDIFTDLLRSVLLERFGTDGILLKNFLTEVELSNIKFTKEIMFANMSIINEEIKVPQLIECNSLKKEIYTLLEITHNKVKNFLSERRKAGKPIPEKKELKPEKILTFDTAQEASLLKQLEKAKDAVQRHFIYIYLQDFYYKYRTLDNKYLEKCKEYCLKDINSLDEMFNEYIQREADKMKNIYDEEEVDKRIKKIKEEGFPGYIPAFSRLAIIYEKEGNIEKAIEVCKQVIESKIFCAGEYFSDKIKKLQAKLQNTSN